MPARLGHHNARNENSLAAGTKGIVLSVRKNIRANDRGAGMKQEGAMGITNKEEPVDMKLEVVVVGVSDVDRAKAFYEKLGWRLDADFVKGDDFRVIPFTPHNSQASMIFGKGVPSPKPGSVQSLTLAVDDIEAARKDLIGRGAKVSEVFQYAGGPFNNTGKNPRFSGRDPEGRSYFSFASFEDPDGNGYLLEESKHAFPAENANRRQRKRSTSPR